jgi:3-carboxy-cis,cis-muconate cycloisomerase
MSYTVQQSALHSSLLGEHEVLALFSEEQDIAAMRRFEAALASAQVPFGIVSQEAAHAIAASIISFRPDMEKLRQGVLRDGMVVPNLVEQLRGHIGATHSSSVHLGATSQDVIDTSLMLRAKRAFAIVEVQLAGILETLGHLELEFGSNRIMAHTRMQRALPVSVADRIGIWQSGVETNRKAVRALTFPVQLGGPVGDLRDYGEHGLALRAALAAELQLDLHEANWHAERSPILALANASCAVTGALGKLGMDVCLMAQNELGEVKLAGGGKSSAMHHKQNPVLAETLVAQARFNATLVSGLQHAMVHEQERSGTAWTLEWMLLPQMIVTAASATGRATELLASIVAIGEAAPQ